jgi:cytochrome d ubiquinol oxidase subunit II
VSHVFTPFVAAAAVTMAGLMAVHGAAFLALRLPAGPATRIAAAGRRMVPAVLVAVAAATLLGLLSDRVRHAVQQPAVALLLPLLLAGALLIARGALTRSRPGWAFAATTSALALPVLLVGATTWPYALISSVDPTASLTVNSATADAATLRLLGWLLAAFLPALLGFQAMCWWVFRGRVDKRTPVYW